MVRTEAVSQRLLAVSIGSRCGFRQVQMSGLTGPVRFVEGRRSDLRLDLLKLLDGGMRKVGSWSRPRGVVITNRTAFYGSGQPNVTLVVTTILVSQPNAGAAN